MQSRRNARSTVTPPVRDELEELGDDGNGTDAGDDGAPADELEPRRPLSKKQRTSKIAELLAGADGEDSDGDDTGDGDGDDDTGDGTPDGDGSETNNTAPKTLAELAETLGVKVEDLYAVEFRDGAEGKGKPHTLGELKDLLAKDTDHDARELEFLERKTKTENELLRAKQDLSYILQRIPKQHLTAEMATKARAERERIERVESQRTLEEIPEWADEATRESERDAMSAHIQQYGFGPADLDRIIDHRMVKMIRDSWQRSERVRKALEKVKEGNKAAPSKRTAGGPAKRGAPNQVTASSPKKQKVAAIAQLLTPKQRSN